MRWTTEVQISPTEMEKLRNSAIKTSTSLQFLPSTEGMNKRKMIRANGSAKYLTHHDSLITVDCGLRDIYIFSSKHNQEFQWLTEW